MTKQLADMPDDVRASAWCNNTRWYLKPTQWLWTGFLYGVLFAIVFAWWVPAYWILVANLPFDAITYGIPKVRNFIGWSYLATGVVAIAFHWYDLQMHIPRKDRRFPVIGDDVFPRELIRRLSWHVLGFAALLALACAMRSHGSTGYWTHLAPALAMGALGSCLLYYSYRPLTYGLRVPSESEVAAAGYIQEQRLLTPPSAAADYATPVEKRAAAIRFSDIFGMRAVKDKLLEPAQRILAPRATGEPPPNGILLHGEPGNGKTIFAEALAGELGVPFVEMTYGTVSSKWVGEMPRVITNCFAYARHNAPCVLFVDEIDSFIRSRDEFSNNSEDQKVTNTLLTEIVNLRRQQVVLIAATNFLAKLDAAAIREGRFDYKVEITPPDEEARIGLVRNGISRYAQTLDVEQDAAISVAKRWNGFSAGRLMAVIKALPEYARSKGLSRIGYDDWIAVLRSVQGRKGKVPEHAKSLDDLVLESGTREALAMIANRLKDVSRVEAMGGSLPTGVLFHGASGTGKTAAARALAKACGWSFLTVAGPELAADRDRLPRLYAEAKDMRPSVIFIDEADEVMRNRQYSATPDITNRLLVLMDGVDDRVRDVIIVAATNHPDQIDPALLRAGRFTEKVEFFAPPQDQVPNFIASWLEQRSVSLAPGIDAVFIASAVQGETIANIEGVLQYALNRSIDRNRDAPQPVLAAGDIVVAVRVVVAGTGA